MNVVFGIHGRVCDPFKGHGLQKEGGSWTRGSNAAPESGSRLHQWDDNGIVDELRQSEILRWLADLYRSNPTFT